MYRTIKARWAKFFSWVHGLVFMVRKPEFTSDKRKTVIGWNKFREVFLFKHVDDITLHDCRRLGLEPVEWCFRPELSINGEIIFAIGKTKIKFVFNFDDIVQRQLLRLNRKEGEKGAPYLESTIKELYPEFYEMWDMYNQRVK